MQVSINHYQTGKGPSSLGHKPYFTVQPWRTVSRYKVPLVALLLVFFTAQSIAAVLPDFSELIQDYGKAVVNIRTTPKAISDVARHQALPEMPQSDMFPEFFKRFFDELPEHSLPESQRKSAIGSGFIIDADGYILTNEHVVRDAGEIFVRLSDRRELKARVVGSDKHSDIALLKIDAGNLPVVKLGNSDELVVGQWVLAIGAPFGFDYTATQGIVSALSRSLPDGTYVPFIQTDVAVNPGSSGGPLFDLEGKVVGMNAQIYSRSGGYQGLSFAIPINLAKKVAGQLKETGYVSRGWLGVTIQGMDQSLAESFGLDKPEGALVAEVQDGSPADDAGIRAGDVILRYDNRAVAKSSDLPLLVGATAAGKSVEVQVLRSGKKRVLNVKIDTLEEERENLKLSARETGRLGLLVSDLKPAERKQLGLKEKGVRVREVDPQGPAAKAGIRADDVFLSFNHQKVGSTQQLNELVSKVPADTPIAVLVMREEGRRFLTLTIPESVG